MDASSWLGPDVMMGLEGSREGSRDDDDDDNDDADDDDDSVK